MFEGYLVHWNGEQKSVKNRTPNSPSKNNESTDSESVAVDMLLGDDTGPIFTTLWNDAAIEFIEQCDAMNRTEDRGSLEGVIINLDLALVTVVPKNDWNGMCITPVRNLQSVATIKTRTGTTVTLTRTASSPYMQNQTWVVPPQEVCIASFASLKTKLNAPFRVTVRGVVQDLQDLDFSQQGNEVRYFKLVDASGYYLQCAAMHHNAHSRALEEDNEIILYFGTGRGPIGTSDGMLFALREGCMVPLSKKFLAPAGRVAIQIKDSGNSVG